MFWFLNVLTGHFLATGVPFFAGAQYQAVERRSSLRSDRLLSTYKLLLPPTDCFCKMLPDGSTDGN